MLEALNGGRAFVRIIREHGFDERDSIAARVLDDHFEALRLVRRKPVVHLLRQFVALCPICIAGSTEHFADLPHLVVLRLAGEERPHGKELCHDGPEREDVYGTVVVW